MKLKPARAICMGLAFSLAACRTQETLTDIRPYSSIVGRHYVLKSDCYTFYYRGNRKQLFIATPKVDSTLPRDLESRQLPRKFGSITINGFVQKGSEFVVVRICREHTIEGSWYYYLASVTTAGARLSMVDVTPLLDTTKQPPVVIAEIASEQ